MKFYDIKDSLIEKDGYVLKFTNKGIVGKATPKNRMNVNIPDNDAQIQANIDTMIRLMKSKDEVYGDIMVTVTRIGEPQKALLIEISKRVNDEFSKKSDESIKKSEEQPVRRGRKPNVTGENTGDSNGQDR